MMAPESRLERLSPAKRALLERRLNGAAAIHAASAPEQSVITPDPAKWTEPFPLTEIQQAYWIGRRPEFELGNVAMHVYFELEAAGLDVPRLNRAWNLLIRRHAMLRAIVLPEGSIQVIDHVPEYTIDAADLRSCAPEIRDARSDAIRRELSHQVLPTGRWPLFEIRAAHLGGGRTRLCCSIDGLIADATSLIVVLKEWARLYQNPDAVLEPLRLGFRDYVMAARALEETELYRTSLAYWQSRIPEMPAGPRLPLASQPATIRQPRFFRLTGRLPADLWLRFKAQSSAIGVTPSAALLAAFGETLRQWAGDPAFTLNVTVFNRLPLHPQVNGLVGDFTSLIPVVMTASPGPFQEQARAAQQELFLGLNHRHVSGVRVLREYAKLHGSAAAAPMPVVFTSGLTLGDSGDTYPYHLLGDLVYGINQTPQVWLDHQVMEEGGGLLFHWEAVEGLFPAGMVEDMFAGYSRLIERLASDPECWSRPAPNLTPEAQLAERARVNATEADCPQEDLYQLFRRQATRDPSAPAILAHHVALTYGELDELSRRIAGRLLQMGAQRDRLIAVVMEKGWRQVAAVMGIIASGAAYLPVDPGLPRERLWWMLERGDVAIALTERSVEQRLEWPPSVRRVAIDAEQWGPASEPASVDPGRLAYVLFTSGSTGVPKGVMVEHASVVNRIADVNRRFAIGPGDRVLALTALHHDLSVYDVFGSLAAGAAIVTLEESASRDPAYWSEIMRRHGVTVWNSVPAFLEMLVEFWTRAGAPSDERTSSLRLALLAGDWIPVPLPDRLRLLLPGARVISLGGPTETTVWDICYPVGDIDPAWRSIPYGRPMANARYYVLDSELRERPVWAAGELYIGGRGLARGYWREPAMTAGRFFEHPEAGERLYRSGDLGRWLPGGNIEFLGRADLQVKIGGQRIELEEIESALSGHPGVQSCAVAVQGEGSSRTLAAYVVFRPGTPRDSQGLRAFLAAKLPVHMVPPIINAVDALPLTPNGKVDRRSLAAARPVEPASQGVEAAPGDPLAARIAALAMRAFNVPHAEPDDDFFSLGASSIEIVKLANVLEQEFGHRPPIQQLVRLNTAAALAGYYSDRKPEHVSNPQTATPSVLLDPAERDQFKNRQLGLRRFAPQDHAVALAAPPMDGDFAIPYRRRRTCRTFGPAPLSAEQLGNFLSCLRRISLDGAPKYRWASGGGLYPVQIYLYLKPERVRDLDAGTWYYHPALHRLCALDRGVVIPRDVHFWNNQAAFDAAAFCIFLVADMRAIEPMYADQSMSFCLIEAGIIAHLLETEAAAHEIGMCQVANVNFDLIRPHFHLEDEHRYLHGILGGPLPPRSAVEPAAGAWEEGEL